MIYDYHHHIINVIMKQSSPQVERSSPQRKPLQHKQTTNDLTHVNKL